MNISLLDQRLDVLCGQERFSGVIRVTRQEKILYEKYVGYANREENRPFTPESMFTLYSMSKPFCALGLLLQADRGGVDLDAHPGVYVPEAMGFDPRVTIRQMLCHTSGLPDFLEQPRFKDTPPADHLCNIRTYLRELTAYPQAFAPGTGNKYSNINYTLCALILENVTGQPYADYMHREVFAPLGAKTLRVDDGSPLPDRVRGYRLDENDQIVPTEFFPCWMLGGGDLIGTVEDVYCLHKAVKENLLLKPETWAQALTPNPINHKGFGCTVTQWHGLRRITHNGGHRGFRTFHIHLPEEDFDVIILSNAGYGNARQPILELIYQAFFDDKAASEAPMELDYGLQ